MATEVEFVLVEFSHIIGTSNDTKYFTNSTHTLETFEFRGILHNFTSYFNHNRSVYAQRKVYTDTDIYDSHNTTLNLAFY